MVRDFEGWFSTFRRGISDYRYYTGFGKVYKNVDAVKVELNILNSLVGSKDVEKDFGDIIARYPETLKCVPMLLAVRSAEISATDGDGERNFRFDNPNYGTEEYKAFMRKTGLFDLIENRIVGSLTDYATGVETGLDSNGRKNRGGRLMEKLVEKYIRKAGFAEGASYFKKMYTREIGEKWGVDLSALSNRGKTEKRFDFVLKTGGRIYAVESNFYASGGRN